MHHIGYIDIEEMYNIILFFAWSYSHYCHSLPKPSSRRLSSSSRLTRQATVKQRTVA